MLTLDTLFHIFKTNDQRLRGSFKQIEPLNAEITEKKYDELFPVVALVNYNYYFIHGSWHQLDEGNYLNKLLTVTNETDAKLKEK